MRFTNLPVILLAAAALTACPKPRAPELSSLQLSPENSRFSTGTSVDFIATGTFADGSLRVVTDEVSWQVDDRFVAAIDPDVPGRVKGLNAGSAKVRASLGDVSRSLSFTITGGTVTRLEVSPAQPVVPIGLTVQLGVSAVHADGSVDDVTAAALYSVMGTSAGVSMREGAPGVVTGVSPGKSEVLISFEGVSTRVTVEVTDASVRTLTLSPANPSLPRGTTLRLTATAAMSDGRSLDVTEQAAWTSSALQTVFVSVLPSERGTLTARAEGTAAVRASLKGVEATTTVTVTGATLSRLELSPSQLTLAKGTEADVVATAVYSDGTRRDVSATATWTSSADLVVSPSPSGRLRARDVGPATVRAELAGRSATCGITVTAAELTGLELSPAALSLARGTGAALTATARFTDGTAQDVTEQTLWTVVRPTVASVTNTLGQRGQLTALTIGTTDVLAVFGPRTGTVALTVTAAQLRALQLSPANPTLPLGTSLSLTATGDFTDGTTQDVSAQVTWTSDDATLAAVDPITTPGRVSALALGQTRVRAQLGAVVADTRVTVSATQLVRLELTPVAPTLALGTTVNVSATGVYSDGTSRPLTAQVTWQSTNVAIATVSNQPGSEGLLRAVAVGQTGISASMQGVSASTQVTVSPATLTSLTSSTTAVSLPVGVTTLVTLTGTYSDGSTQDLTQQASWTSMAPAIASASNATGARGALQGVSPGTTTVIAQVGTQQRVITVTVTAAQLSSLALTPALASLPRGTSQAFVATGTFTDGSTRDVSAQVAWTTSGPALSVDPQGLVTAAAQGVADVIARLGTIEGRLTVTVSAAVLTGLGLTPQTPSVPLGVAVSFIATTSWSDGTTQDVTSQVTWQSTDGAVASVSNGPGTAGRATTSGVGTTTVSATFAGLVSSTTLTVQSAALASIEVTPPTARIAALTRRRFQATGRYTDGSTQDLSTQVLWTVSDTALASASNAAPFIGRVSSLAPGQVTVRATRLGVTGTASLDITSATLSTLALSPAAPSVPAGFSQQLVADGTFSDGSTQDLTDLVTWTSSDASQVAISNAATTEGLARALRVGTPTVTASALGVSGAITFTVTNALLVGLEVSPLSDTVPRGLTLDFGATGTFSDGSVSDVTSQVAWSSTNAAVATVSNTPGSRGRASALQTGTTQVTASLSGRSAAGTLTVTAAVLTQLQVSPPTSTVPSGLTTPFTVTGIFSDGSSADLTEQVGWTAAPTTVAQVSSAPGSRGVVQALGVGSATITATAGTLSGTSTVTVTAAQLAAVQVSPSTASVPRGLSRQLSAIGLYTDGTTQDLTGLAAWSSADASLATVSTTSGSEGLTQAVAQGTVTITATVLGLSAAAQVTVTPAVLQQLQVNPASPSVSAGLSRSLSATGVYSDATTQDVTTQVTWSSSASTLVAVSNAPGFEGVVTGGLVGAATVSASLQGVVGSTLVTTTQAVLQQVQVTPTNPSRPRGLQAQLTATGVFSDGSTQDLTTQVTWTSSQSANVSIDNATGLEGLAAALNVGTATLTATLNGVVGTTGFTVTPAQLIGVDVNPATVTLPLGTVRQLLALGRYTDGSTQNVTAQAGWTSGTPAVLDVSNSAGSEGLATTLTTGSSTVSATFAGFTGLAQVTITQAALASIELTPAAGATPLGFSRQFIAIGVYTDNTTQVLTAQATWASSDISRALISNAAANRGLLSTVATGVVTISATFNGVTGTASHTISAATLVSLSLSPSPVSLSVAGTRALTAMGSLSDGSTQDLTTSVTWTSLSPGIADVSNAGGARGLVTGVAVGSTTIRAALGGVTGSASVTVTP